MFLVFYFQALFFRLINDIPYDQKNNEECQQDNHNFGGPDIDAAHHKKEYTHRFFVNVVNISI